MTSVGITFAVAGLLTAVVVGWLMRESDFEMGASWGRSDDGVYLVSRRVAMFSISVGIAMAALYTYIAFFTPGPARHSWIGITLGAGALGISALGAYQCATTRVIVQNGELISCSGRKRRRILLRSIESVEIPHYSLIKVRHAEERPLILPTFLKGAPRLLATLREWERRNATAWTHEPGVVDDLVGR